MTLTICVTVLAVAALAFALGALRSDRAGFAAWGFAAFLYIILFATALGASHA